MAGTAAAAAYVRTVLARIRGYGSGRMRVRLIVNAAATGVRGPVLDAVIAALRDAAETEDAVVALGGDGTYNEIANGLPQGSLMGVLPAGASSVFARHLGYVNDPAAAARQLADALRAGSSRSIGLGVADGRVFTFAAGLGLDAEATAIVDRTRHERPGNERPGDLQVLATALRVLRAEGFALHERMTLTAAGGISHRCSYLAVANQHPYT